MSATVARRMELTRRPTATRASIVTRLGRWSRNLQRAVYFLHEPLGYSSSLPFLAGQ